MELSYSNIKKFLIFQEPEYYYVSGNGTFLCFTKLFIFQEVTVRDQNLKNFYISGGNLQSLKVKKYYTFSYKEVKFSKLTLICPNLFFRKMYLLKRG